jgi:hypothetical protein
MKKAIAALAVITVAAVTPSPVSAQVPTTGEIVLPPNVSYKCNRAVNIDRLVITLTTLEKDAFVMNSGCTGRVGRLEVTTFTQDPLKTTNADAAAAHDLLIEGGWAICPTRAPGAHQDGWQAMGGARLTVRDFVWDCGDMADPFGSGVAQVFVVGKAGAGATTPTDVVVEHSVLMPGASQTVAVGVSLRSGVRDSILCPDRTPRGGTFRVLGGIDVVNTGNTNAALDDPRCADMQAAIAWAGG